MRPKRLSVVFLPLALPHSGHVKIVDELPEIDQLHFAFEVFFEPVKQPFVASGAKP
jgi:hypothetical protein